GFSSAEVKRTEGSHDEKKHRRRPPRGAPILVPNSEKAGRIAAIFGDLAGIGGKCRHFSLLTART
ncbi:MAG: hypothetical protein OEQ30_05550, partial [Gammaproteobacteria bacterium]|nr:hypothetical protein [Gammaproteobacteria bacterium]